MNNASIDKTSLEFLNSLATNMKCLDKQWVTTGSLMQLMHDWAQECGVPKSHIGTKRMGATLRKVLGKKCMVDLSKIEPKNKESTLTGYRNAYQFDRVRVMTSYNEVIEPPQKRHKSAEDDKQPTKCSTVPEHEISNTIAIQENGQREVTCRFGRIDVLTATEVIEVKRVADYKAAIGQVICYVKEFPGHKPRVHLYGPGTLAQYHNAIVAISGEGIRCTLENAIVGTPLAHPYQNTQNTAPNGGS